MEERTQSRTAAPVRIRVALGGRSADLAVPVDLALIDLLPSVLPRLDPDAADHGLEHEGWVVQRLGEEPLDETRTAAELGLVDGETVHLRPRADVLPAIDFDDVVDGVAEQVREAQGFWTGRRTRSMLLTLAGLVLLGGGAVLALDGPVGVRALVGALLVPVLLLGAGLASRAARNPLAGTVLVGAAVLLAAQAGWLLAVWSAPTASTSVRFGCAVLGALIALCVGIQALADAALLFTAGVTFLLAVGGPAALAGIAGYDPQRSAAVALALTLVVATLLPATAFGLGGLTLPMLPGNPEELTDDITPAPHEMVVRRGAATIGYLSALSVGLGGAQALLAVVLIEPGGRWPILYALAAAALLFVRARNCATAVQRWAVLLPGVVLVAAVVLRWTADRGLVERLAIAIPALVAVAVALLVASALIPGRRFRPYWARAADLGETLLAILVVPLLGAVLNVYQLLRGWVGG